MKRRGNLALICALLVMLFWMPIGCGSSGGGGSSSTPAPNLYVDRTTFDFGDVTTSKTGTLQVTIQNTGSADLSVNDLTISDLVNFNLDTGTCGSAPYTLAAGSSCSVTLSFTPTEVKAYSETMTISSNDGDYPTYQVTLTGQGTEPSALTVSLNQIGPSACPTIKAYVTVTDQNGFLVDGLVANDFTITENSGTGFQPGTVEVAQTTTLSMAAAIVMDYSPSVTDDPVFTDAMEAGATAFVNDLGAADMGEIIKFASTVSVIQAFTGDKSLLVNAIQARPDLGIRTALYDAIYQAILDASGTSANRRAVLVLTDGVDYGGGSLPGSVYTLDEVKTLAKAEGVPVFTIGIGPEVNPAILQDIAYETGGQYYADPEAKRIITIFAQLSELLNSQYVLTYDSSVSGPGSDVVADVTVADQGTALGDTSNPLSYTECP